MISENAQSRGTLCLLWVPSGQAVNRPHLHGRGVRPARLSICPDPWGCVWPIPYHGFTSRGFFGVTAPGAAVSPALSSPCNPYLGVPQSALWSGQNI